MSRNLRYALGAENLADLVLRFNSSVVYITWPDFLTLSGTSVQEKNDQILNEYTNDPVEYVPSTTESPKTSTSNAEANDDIEWGFSQKQNPSVIALDGSQNKDSIKQSFEPVTGRRVSVDPIDAATILFNKIDKNQDGIVTHIELIKFLRANPSIASVKN